jgi:hypothetical protein
MSEVLYQVFFKAKQWQVKERSARCAAGKFAEQAEALACAKGLAAEHPGPIQLLAADGSVERELAAPKTKA